MSGRRVRGRLKSLSQTGHRQKKKAHNEQTNRLGKAWAARHVEPDAIDLEAQRKRLAVERRTRRVGD